MLGLILAVSLSFVGVSQADSIDDFNASWTGKALDKQRALDTFAPIIDNNILGSHNTYNSEAYSSCNVTVGCRYLDPQQKYSIKNQLRMGARFIELDVHWTAKMESLFSYPNRLLLCHGVCSLNDKYATEGFDEIEDWLADDSSRDEVIILYIEDASDGHHNDLYNQMNDRFGDKIYASGGCGNIPDSLTKADVLAAGKQVILYKDGGCSSNTNMVSTAFTGMGKVGRIWEDSTTIGTIGEFFSGGIDSITASEVSEAFETGANVVNLDDLVMDDGRIKAAIWSWDGNEPNNSGNQDCAAQWGNGRWDDNSCTGQFSYACEDSSGNWFVPANTKGAWANGDSVCEAQGGSFSVPTNSQDNQALKTAKDAAGYTTAWLNYTDAASEGNWLVAGKSTVFSEVLPGSFKFTAGDFVLKAGESITTKTRYMVMQNDGNFVIYKYGNGTVGSAQWSSGTRTDSGGSSYKVGFQGDGNLVVRNGSGSAKWASGSNPSGQYMYLQGDGNLVIRNSSGGTVWAAGSN